MKNRLMNNWQLKLLSLAGAVLLWLVVVSVSNPVRTQTFSGIPVEVVNSSAITSEGKVYEVLDNSNVISIEVTARRDVNLKREDFKAVADMQNIQLMKYVPITITCTKNVLIEEIATKTPNLKISIEDSDTKTLPIVVRTTGTPGSGYMVDTVNTLASPESVRVTGAASAVSKISRAFAEVDVSGMTMDTERVTSLTLYDGNGEPVRNSSLTYNIDTSSIDVSVKLLRTKEVPIRVSTSGTAADGYQPAQVSCEPSTISLAGEEEVLKSVTSVEIPASEINISQASKDVEKVVDISPYLPEGVQLAELEEATVAVTVKIEKLEDQTVVLKKDEIELLNVPEGYTATFLTTTDLSIQVRALKETLESLNVTDWKASVDLAEYTEAGTYEVPVNVTVPEGYELTEELIAVIKLEENAEETAAE